MWRVEIYSKLTKRLINVFYYPKPYLHKMDKVSDTAIVTRVNALKPIGAFKS